MAAWENHCLGHLTEGEVVLYADHLRRGAPVDARGASISDTALARLFEALAEGGNIELPRCDFGGAKFSGSVNFTEVVFKETARFSGAEFDGGARFVGATFHGPTRFRGVTFRGLAEFREAHFRNGVNFVEAEPLAGFSFDRAHIVGTASFSRFEPKGSVSFAGVTLEGNANFRGAEFHDRVKFGRAAFMGNTDFRGATFAAEASFGGARFGGIAFFEHVHFLQETRFRRAVFDAAARFHGGIFAARAHMNEVSFNGPVGFHRVVFQEKAIFSEAHFQLAVSFQRARFGGVSAFGGAVFEREAIFESATFEAGARFAGARFEGEVWFGGSEFAADASFRKAVFRRAREFGPLSAGRLDIDGAVFRDHVLIEVDAAGVSGVGSTFSSGTHLKVRRAEMALDQADFVRQSTILGLASRPRLLSLEGAHVAPLILSDVDLRPCRFFGAHGLESMRIEGSCLWPSSPPGRWGGGRETIAEEHHWRHRAESRRRGRMKTLASVTRAGSQWYGEPMRAASLRQDGGAESPDPEQIAAVYRSLRKAREDSKDEAGAGDLYYGEMEMRRHSGSAASGDDHRGLPWGERAILNGYWLVSGYGLRASRALACLALVLTICAGLLCWFGFPGHDYDYGHSLLFAAESSISLLRPPEAALSAGGQVVQIALRLFGPLFFGLALLAVRARVKR